MKTRKVAVVTGGTRGLGRAMSLALAEDGYSLALVYQQDSAAARRTATEVAAYGEEAFLFRADLRHADQAAAMAEAVRRRFNRVDVLINNVGPFIEKPLSRVTPEEWRDMQAGNLDSVFFVCRALAPLMKRRRRGRILTVGVVTTLRPRAFRRTLPYATAKAGVLLLTRSLAAEWAPHGITVNALLPGLMDNGTLSAARRRALAAQVPAGRTGRGEDLVAAMRFLISEEAAYVTGSEIAVSGGWGL